MPETTLRFLVLIAICLLPGNEVCSLNEEESCVSYGPGAGSHVYPGGSKSDGHQLQYTKAVSKFKANTKCFFIHYTMQLSHQHSSVESKTLITLNKCSYCEKNYTFSDYSS